MVPIFATTPHAAGLPARAVLASVTPTARYGELLPTDAVPSEVGADARRYHPGRQRCSRRWHSRGRCLGGIPR
jgi:hypothetical protein